MARAVDLARPAPDAACVGLKRVAAIVSFDSGRPGSSVCGSSRGVVIRCGGGAATRPMFTCLPWSWVLLLCAASRSCSGEMK